MFVGGCVCGGLRVRDCHRSTFITVVRELGEIGDCCWNQFRWSDRRKSTASFEYKWFLERFLEREVEHDTSSCIFETAASV